MKRDLDLFRQLLFDIEARGAECSFSTLRPEADHEPVAAARNGHDTAPLGYRDDAVRRHLRLLIDAGLVKEVDRTNGGVPCVRLTNAGHELIELCRSDVRWRDAKACCLDATGGLSLIVVRTILTKWAVESAATGVRHLRRRSAYRPLYYRRVEPRRRYDSGRYEYGRYDYDYGYDYPLQEEDDLRLGRTRPTDYRETHRESWVRPAYDRYDRDYLVRETPAYEAEVVEPTVGVSLPVSLI